MQNLHEDEIEYLLNEGGYDCQSPKEEKKAIESILQFEKYVPNGEIENMSSSLYNPALQGYVESGLSWSPNGWVPVDDTTPLSKYPEYVPSDEAIQIITQIGPVIEVGAGNGYLSHVIDENGGNIIATDLYPHESSWFEVHEEDAVHGVINNKERDVLMCHPSGATPWSEYVLDSMEKEQRLIYIGEWFPGADSTPYFFKKLVDSWELEETFPVYNWASTHAQGYIFGKIGRKS